MVNVQERAQSQNQPFSERRANEKEADLSGELQRPGTGGLKVLDHGNWATAEPKTQVLGVVRETC